MRRIILLTLAALSLAGCGGDSSSSSSNSSQAVEKALVRSHLDDVYLWNNEITDVSPGNYATAPDYFDALLVRTRDRFSFSMPVAEATSLFDEGMETGYGVRWGWGGYGRLYAYYVDPNSPAAAAITRGSEVTAINGQAVPIMSNASLNSALFPRGQGVSVNLAFREPGTNTTRNQSLVSQTFSTTTVEHPVILNLQDGVKVGYLLFNEHLRTSEQGLIDAFSRLKDQGVNELVLDMRYNPGGYLYIAREVASMIGGAAVQGRTFEKLQFNSRHPEKTSNPLNTLYFTSRDSKGYSLPLLGLSRVFVLSGPQTCSASESVINSLLPFLQVVQIGSTTCGKPYGSSQANYGANAYFALQMEGVNANGTDDYKGGFSPVCEVDDDLNYPLGDLREARLHAALFYMSNNRCPGRSDVPLPKALTCGQISTSGDGQLLEQKPGVKLLK